MRMGWGVLSLAAGLVAMYDGAGAARARDRVGQPAAGDAVFARAIEYVGAFERTFSAMTWHERYEQEDRMRRPLEASGSAVMRVVGRRQLDAQLLLVWLPVDASWIAVRDVIAIDGTARPDADRQLAALSSGGSQISMAQLRTLAAANGRFNIGKIVRTFNEPTLALLFLDERYRHRFEFARRGEQKIESGTVRVYSFVERARPTVVRSGERDVPTHGTLWIDPDTGRILQTTMELTDVRGLRGTVTVRYGPHPNVDVLVPIEMRETYAADSGEEVTAVATYSDFHGFEASGRLIVPQ